MLMPCHCPRESIQPTYAYRYAMHVSVCHLFKGAGRWRCDECMIGYLSARAGLGCMCCWLRLGR